LQSSSLASWPSALSAGPTSLRFPVPPTASFELAPHKWLVSSTRFRSQDCGLATASSQRFPSRLEVCGPVSDRTVLGIPPFRVFPSQQIAHASRRSLASLWLSSGVPSRTTRVLSPAVSPTSTLSRVCLVPPPAISSLSTHRSTLPGCCGARAAEPSRSASFTHFEASIPPASPFATGSGLPSPTGRYPPGFLPL
jgi:hypothetical protein